MSAYDFVYILTEHEVAYLWTSIDVIYWLQGMCVPESDTSIGSAATWCKKSILMRTPSNSFDSGGMITELGKWLLTVESPDHQFVIVASRC